MSDRLATQLPWEWSTGTRQSPKVSDHSAGLLSGYCLSLLTPSQLLPPALLSICGVLRSTTTAYYKGEEDLRDSSTEGT